MINIIYTCFFISIFIFSVEVFGVQGGNSFVQRTCPHASELIKQGDVWGTADAEWRSYTPSGATQIVSYLGTQWDGIKVGHIICLYQTNEAVSFPLALNKIRGQVIIEPSGFGWSALTGTHKFCQSANVADCPFYSEPVQGPVDIYAEIKYNPASWRSN
jgi:hypothetical protein